MRGWNCSTWIDIKAAESFGKEITKNRGNYFYAFSVLNTEWSFSVSFSIPPLLLFSHGERLSLSPVKLSTSSTEMRQCSVLAPDTPYCWLKTPWAAILCVLGHVFAYTLRLSLCFRFLIYLKDYSPLSQYQYPHRSCREFIPQVIWISADNKKWKVWHSPCEVSSVSHSAPPTSQGTFYSIWLTAMAQIATDQQRYDAWGKVGLFRGEFFIC